MRAVTFAYSGFSFFSPSRIVATGSTGITPSSSHVPVACPRNNIRKHVRAPTSSRTLPRSDHPQSDVQCRHTCQVFCSRPTPLVSTQCYAGQSANCHLYTLVQETNYSDYGRNACLQLANPVKAFAWFGVTSAWQ